MKHVFVTRINADLSGAAVTLAVEGSPRMVPPWTPELTRACDLAMAKLLGGKAQAKQEGQVRSYQVSNGWTSLEELLAAPLPEPALETPEEPLDGGASRG